jgi:protoheme IX farnesyltransferase
MLPVVEGEEPTARQIFYYTLALIPVTLLLVYPLNVMGPVYAAIALLLGGIFVKKAWELMQNPSDLLVARSVFKYSILYLMLLCAGMALDSLPVTHQIVSQVTNSVLATIPSP